MKKFIQWTGLFIAGLSILTLVLESDSHAARRRGIRNNTGGQDMRILPVGGGISSPSSWSSLYQNPAALTFNSRPKVQLSGGGSTEDFDAVPHGVGFTLGNGWVGAGGAYEGSYNALTQNYDFGVAAGLAAMVPQIGLSFGLAGSKTIYQAGTTVDAAQGWSTSAGALYSPMSNMRFGVQVFDFVGGVNELGFGASFDLSNYATFTVDAGWNLSANGLELLPAIAVYIQQFQATFGYAFDAANAGSTSIPDGITAGVGYMFGHRMAVQIMYTQLYKMYAGVTIHM